jgi:hypothetical protein
MLVMTHASVHEHASECCCVSFHINVLKLQDRKTSRYSCELDCGILVRFSRACITML